jgi:hypothetical protein
MSYGSLGAFEQSRRDQMLSALQADETLGQAKQASLTADISEKKREGESAVGRALQEISAKNAIGEGEAGVGGVLAPSIFRQGQARFQQAGRYFQSKAKERFAERFSEQEPQPQTMSEYRATYGEPDRGGTGTDLDVREGYTEPRRGFDPEQRYEPAGEDAPFPETDVAVPRARARAPPEPEPEAPEPETSEPRTFEQARPGAQELQDDPFQPTSGQPVSSEFQAEQQAEQEADQASRSARGAEVSLDEEIEPFAEEGTAGLAEGAMGVLGDIAPFAFGIFGLYEAIKDGMDEAKEEATDPYAKARGLIAKDNQKIGQISSQISADQFESKVGMGTPKFGSMAVPTFDTSKAIGGMAQHF